MNRDVRFDVSARATGAGAPDPLLIITNDLQDRRLTEAAGQRVDFDSVTVERVDFSDMTIQTFTSANSRFIDCDFSRTRFQMAGGFSFDPPSSFVRCTFDRADLRAMLNLAGTRFEACRFINSRIVGWRSDCAEFVDCVFTGKIVRSRFRGRPVGCSIPVARERNDFSGNDFRGAELIDTSFVNGIDIDGQMWPEDRMYIRLDRWQERRDRARARIARWANDDEREPALKMLRIYSEAGFEEQSVVFARRDDVTIPTHIRDHVWTELERS